ncbi:TPA: hypothetical protein ACKRAB_000783 [Streptococcus pyogenes]
MLTSKHHNINKLVWRYGLTSAAAVLLAFGGGVSSVKAEGATLSTEERTKKLKKLKSLLILIQNCLMANFGIRTGLEDHILRKKII